MTTILPKITVSILLYNSEKHLDKTLESLKNQTYPYFEVIALDNGSKDNSAKIFKRHFPTSKLITLDNNCGFSEGNNKIIKQASTPYVFLLNDDVFLKPKYFECLIELMERDPKIASASGFLYRMENDKQTRIADGVEIIPHKSFRFTTKHEGQLLEKFRQEPFEVWGLSAPAIMYRTGAIQDVAIFDDEFFDKDFFAYKEDVDMAWRLRSRGWKAYVEPKATGYHARGLRGKEGMGEMRNAIKHLRRNYTQNYLSFRNQIFLRYKNLSGFLRKKYFYYIYWFEVKKIVFTLIFAPRLVRAFIEARQQKGKMLEKRKKILQNATTTSIDAIEKWIQ